MSEIINVESQGLDFKIEVLAYTPAIESPLFCHPDMAFPSEAPELEFEVLEVSGCCGECQHGYSDGQLMDDVLEALNNESFKDTRALGSIFG